MKSLSYSLFWIQLLVTFILTVNVVGADRCNILFFYDYDVFQCENGCCDVIEDEKSSINVYRRCCGTSEPISGVTTSNEDITHPPFDIEREMYCKVVSRSNVTTWKYCEYGCCNDTDSLQKCCLSSNTTSPITTTSSASITNTTSTNNIQIENNTNHSIADEGRTSCNLITHVNSYVSLPCQYGCCGLVSDNLPIHQKCCPFSFRIPWRPSTTARTFSFKTRTPFRTREYSTTTRRTTYRSSLDSLKYIFLLIPAMSIIPAVIIFNVFYDKCMERRRKLRMEQAAEQNSTTSSSNFELGAGLHRIENNWINTLTITKPELPRLIPTVDYSVTTRSCTYGNTRYPPAPSYKSSYSTTDKHKPYSPFIPPIDYNTDSRNEIISNKHGNSSDPPASSDQLGDYYPPASSHQPAALSTYSTTDEHKPYSSLFPPLDYSSTSGTNGISTLVPNTNQLRLTNHLHNLPEVSELILSPNTYNIFDANENDK